MTRAVFNICHPLVKGNQSIAEGDFILGSISLSRYILPDRAVGGCDFCISLYLRYTSISIRSALTADVIVYLVCIGLRSCGGWFGSCHPSPRPTLAQAVGLGVT